MMRAVTGSAFLLFLAASPLAALDAKVGNAVAAFAAVEADAQRTKTFCAMNRLLAAASEEKDAAVSEAEEKEIMTHMTALGPEFQAGWELGAELNPESEDGKAMIAALDKLEAKCDQ